MIKSLMNNRVPLLVVAGDFPLQEAALALVSEAYVTVPLMESMVFSSETAYSDFRADGTMRISTLFAELKITSMDRGSEVITVCGRGEAFEGSDEIVEYIFSVPRFSGVTTYIRRVG